MECTVAAELAEIVGQASCKGFFKMRLVREGSKFRLLCAPVGDRVNLTSLVVQRE